MGAWATPRLADLVMLVSKNPAKYCGAISRLVRDGLKTNNFGMDFSDVVQKRGSSWTMDDDIKLAFEMYWGNSWTEMNKQLVAVDYELRYRPRDMSMFVYGPRDRFSDFFRNGYVKITDFGVDVDRLREEIRVAKRAQTWEEVLNGKNRWAKNMHLRSLDGLMKNKAILELVSFYMGSDVIINGYQYWHTDALATKERVTTGDWHHDSCGTRVKIFVYLHDVDEDRMPTEVAIGSQAHLKYVFGGYMLFKDQAVHEAWKVDRMMGSAGGGFIFDPNTIHRSYMEGPHRPRDVVVVDISSAVKADVGIPNKATPCPRPDWWTEALHQTEAFQGGDAGFQYPERTHGPHTKEYVENNKGNKKYHKFFIDHKAKFTATEWDAFLDTETRPQKDAAHQPGQRDRTSNTKKKDNNPCAGRGRSCRFYR